MKNLLIAIALTPVYWLIYGNTAHYLWMWFVTPIFAAPTISLWQATGLVMLAKFATWRLTKDDLDSDAKDGKALERFTFLALYPLPVLGSAWLLKTFFL